MGNNNHGGRREGAGRPPSNRKYQITVRLSKANKEWLDKQANKALYINELISSARVNPFSCFCDGLEKY